MYDDEKTKYVEFLRETLKPMRDFGGIEYVCESYKGGEYIKVWDILGEVLFLDVTGYRLDNILRDVAMIVLGVVPKSVVTNIESKRDIARLFLNERRDTNA